MARRTTDRRTMNVDASSALAGALLFGVQTVLMALWMSAHAAPVQHDAFGGSLCISWAGSRDAGETPGVQDFLYLVIRYGGGGVSPHRTFVSAPDTAREPI